jgi:hypothetical protein
LAHDTGASATDGITRDDTVIGTVADSAHQITRLTAGFDAASPRDFVNLTNQLTDKGTFKLDSDLMNQIARNTTGDRDGDHDDNLSDGQHTLHLAAVDRAGNTSNFDLTFTLNTKTPEAPKFGLAPADVDSTLDKHHTDAATVTLVGTTDPGVTVTLASLGLSTVSDDRGHFELTNVNLAVGRNELTLQATDLAGNTSDFTRTLTREAQLPQGDAVLQWDQITLNAIQQAGLDPVMASRALAMESIAVLDSINAIDKTPGVLVNTTAKGDASADAAVATAAHEVLDALFPGQKVSLDALYQAALARIGSGDTGDGDHDRDDRHNDAKADGVALGTAVADQVLALRANDGSQITGQFDGGPAAGQWQPTGPNFALAIDPQFANVTPFAMSGPDQFLSTVAPPPDLTSAAYATDALEVQLLGSANSTTRTADQTQIAQFWSDGTGTLTEAGQWNAIAARVAQAKGNSLADDARLFGELNVGLADAGIAAWNAKYNFGFWSPVTAIQNADSTGNSQLHSDLAFTPLVTTPAAPEYVETQSTFSAAAADVLTNFFGNNVSFTATSSDMPGVTRNYTSFAQAATEAGRSGIFAGTDFQFSNTAGQKLGQQVGNLVVQAFDISKDTLPPKVLIDQPTKGLVTNTDPVITGHVLDNLSGVASLQVKLDNGAFANVAFDRNGAFTVPVNLPLNGSADGQHALTFVATDALGNASTPLTVSFTLATKAPQVTLAGLQNGSALAAGAMLQGTAIAQSGSTLTGLSYKFDNGTATPVAFDASTGAFDQALDLSRLTVGTHTMTVTATDNAGNVTVSNLSVSLPSLIPLTITSVNPANGAGTVGVTFRPIVQFSRAIDVSTLTGDDFFLTDSAGNKLAATIVPWKDNMHAWLFPANGGAWPGGQTLTLHIDGSQIKGLADGAALDAAGTGQAGSVFTETFTTVDTSPVANTTISGQILDPGTQGNTQVGPNGQPIGTLPLQGVTVYILGHEDEAVQTDAQGRFVLNSTPTGDVKVVIDGRTANAPTGVTFPVLVVDLNVKPGQDNTIAGSRGSIASQLDNTTNPVLVLPRLRTDVMQTLSQTAPTVLHTTADSSPQLTAEQLQEMTLTIQPGTLIGEDGKPLPPDAKVGFSVVPRDDIKDMLPPGLSQHSFDITIQAPGLSSFTTPAQLTLPNVFNLPPGTKTNLLTFDYTTGRLEIDGTATVSADGKTVVTDPGSGVTKIGWHSMTPAGSPTGNNPTRRPAMWSILSSIQASPCSKTPSNAWVNSPARRKML